MLKQVKTFQFGEVACVAYLNSFTSVFCKTLNIVSKDTIVSTNIL